jgi:hypothetical protein
MAEARVRWRAVVRAGERWAADRGGDKVTWHRLDRCNAPHAPCTCDKEDDDATAPIQ